MKTAFFRCTAPLTDEISVGDCIAAQVHSESDSSTVFHVRVSRNSTCIFTQQDMRGHFTPITELEFQAALNALLGEVNGLITDHVILEKEIASASALALGSGDADRPEQETEKGTGLVCAPSGGLRNKALSLKRRMGSLSESLKVRQQKIATMMEQRMEGIGAAVTAMKSHIEKLEEVVWMVNLYLGRDEEITALRSGAKMSQETPITLRQNVLYMDEEVALQYEHGIDYSEITAFDKWLLEGTNLQQVLPEPKGVVVLQVRRQAKEYDISNESLSAAIRDAREASEKNSLNMMSYWLIRNGENLHRLWTDVRVGERLIPTLAEFDGFFQRSGFGQTGPIRPGSREYYDAMKRANGLNRHYMRLGLVLQGIIDRTQVFAPFKDNLRPNIIDEATWNGQVKIIRDEEGTITDGRPPFATWLKAINRELHPGLRVVAGSWKVKIYTRDESKSTRQHPRNASAPDSTCVYTLASIRTGLGFLYERNDSVYIRDPRFYGRTATDPKRKASYMVYDSDTFFVCIDNIHDLAELEYYLNDRRHRRDYETMIPLLKRVLEFKQIEQKAETPFRSLLIQKINEQHPASPCDAPTLSRMIRWWKMSRSEHRALLSDDKQAYKDILAEYSRQFSGDPSQTTKKDLDAISTFANQADTLAVWAQGCGLYRVLRSIPTQPIFCHMEVHARRQAGWTMIERREWIIPRKYNYLRWTPLHATADWIARPESPNAAAFLPAPAFEKLVAWGISMPNPHGPHSNSRLLAIFACNTTKGTSVTTTYWAPDESDYQFRTSRDTNDVAIMDNHHLPAFRERPVSWKNNEDGHSFSSIRGWGTGTWIQSKGVGFEFRRAYAQEDAILLYCDEAAEKQILALAHNAAAHNKRREGLHEWIQTQDAAGRDCLMERWKQRETEKYFSEGGDPEFTADHLKTVRKPHTDLGRSFTELMRACLVKVEGDTGRLTGRPIARVFADLLPPEALVEAMAASEALRDLVAANWSVTEPAPTDTPLSHA